MSKMIDEQRKRASAGTPIKICFVVLTVTIVFSLLLLLASLIFTNNSENPLRIFGNTIVIVNSNTMGPDIEKGDAVIVKEIDVNSLQVGNIIAIKDGYDDNKELIVTTHRIVRLNPMENELSFVTKGDANALEDEKTRFASDVLGKVTFISPTLGDAFAFINTPLGIIMCIGVPLVFVIILEGLNLYIIAKKPKEDFLPMNYRNPNTFSNNYIDEEKLNSKTQKRNKGSALYGTEYDKLVGDDYDVDSSLDDYKDLLDSDFDEAMEDLGVPIFRTKEPYQQPPEAPRKPLTSQEVLQEEMIKRGIMPLSDIDDISALKTFAVINSKTPTSKKEASKDLQVAEKYTNGERDMTIMSKYNEAQFQATVQNIGRDRFLVDGFDVVVGSNSINIGSDGKTPSEFSVVVSKERTNIIIETEKNEINFALFKDENGEEKVTVEKKNRISK